MNYGFNNMEKEKINCSLIDKTEPESITTRQSENELKGNILLSDFFDNAETVLNRLKTATLATLLFKEEKALELSSNYEKCLLKNYQSRMSVYITSLFDKQFDIFTPPRKGFLDEYDISLFFEFYEPQFKIIAKVEKGISVIDLGYELNALPILECLETGVISRELFCILEKMKFQNWDNGISISKCTDFRINPPKEFLIKLTAGSDLINHFSNMFYPEGDTISKLEFEKQALLLQNPRLCTDPSQDVARIYSDIDWRKKMWKNHENVTKNTMTRRELLVHPKVSNTPKIDSNHKTDIRSFQKKIDLLFQNYQV